MCDEAQRAVVFETVERELSEEYPVVTFTESPSCYGSKVTILISWRPYFVPDVVATWVEVTPGKISVVDEEVCPVTAADGTIKRDAAVRTARITDASFFTL